MGSNPPKVVEEALGGAIVKAINTFAWKDIESDTGAHDLFAFVADGTLRDLLAETYRGARWQQKVGFVLARSWALDPAAHQSQVRYQIIDYAAISETALQCMLKQNGSKAVPGTFDEIIKECKSAGILSANGQKAADGLRLARNRVHLHLPVNKKPPKALKHGRNSFRWMTTVINECRKHANLPSWQFGASI